MRRSWEGARIADRGGAFEGNRANKAKRETAIGTQAVEPADEDMQDGQYGG
jgi:hypothetical protein